MGSKDLNSPKSLLQAAKIMFAALVAGLVLFTGIVIFISRWQNAPLQDKAFVKVMLSVVLFSGTFFITVSEKIYRKRIAAAAQANLTLTEKLNVYRAALIVYLAACEGTGLLAVITFFLTGNNLFLVATALTLVAMLLKRPEKFKIFNELQLSTAEQMELN